MKGVRGSALLAALASALLALCPAASASELRTPLLPADRNGEVVVDKEPVADVVFRMPAGQTALTPLGVLWAGRHPAGVARSCRPSAVAAGLALAGPIRIHRDELKRPVRRRRATAVITGAGLAAPRRVAADTIVAGSTVVGRLFAVLHVHLPGDLLPAYPRRDLYLIAIEGNLDDSDPCSAKTERLGNAAVRAAIRDVRFDLPPTYSPPPPDQAPPTADLADGGGLRLTGRKARETAGDRVAAAGDVNGDGYQDAVVTAPYANGRRGAVFVVFGHPGGGTAALDSPAAPGFRIDAPWRGTWRLPAVGVGDMDGDGLADIAVGAPKSGKRDGGAVYIVRGKRDMEPVDLAKRDDVLFRMTGGRRCHGPIGGEFVGQDLAAAGDVNADGVGDLAVLTSGDCGEGALAGTIYVVYGKRGGGDVDLLHLGAGGITARGLDVFQPSLAGVGDVNGDGLGDVLVGDLGYDAWSGYATLIPGRRTGGTVDLRRLPTRLTSARCSDVGYAVSAAGDVNGDGIDDFAVGTPGDCNDLQSRTFVVFGRRDLGAVDLDALGSGGYSIAGTPTFHAGRALAAAGDVNGDGIPDLALGDPDSDAAGREEAGSVIVVYGQRGTDPIRLRSLGERGYRWLGPEAEARFGFWLANAGDFDGDGRPDLIASIPRRDDFAGGAWVLPKP